MSYNIPFYNEIESYLSLAFKWDSRQWIALSTLQCDDTICLYRHGVIAQFTCRGIYGHCKDFCFLLSKNCFLLQLLLLLAVVWFTLKFRVYEPKQFFFALKLQTDQSRQLLCSIQLILTQELFQFSDNFSR